LADVLGIGTSALLSLQRAISVTGNNIANVNTEGFSRQRVEFAALPPQDIGVGFIGSGVGIANITRSYDQFLAGDVRDRTASEAGARTLADLAGRVDGLLADPNTGLAPVLDNFFAAVQDVANNPGSIPERQVLLSRGEELAGRFAYLDGRLSDFSREANVRVDDGVRQINNLATSLAELNDRIVLASAGSSTPNDLLDARDQVLNRLAEVVGVNTVEQADGAVNVFIGNGQSLVVGSNVTELVAFTDPADPTRLAVGVAGQSTPTDIGRFLSGGELGAVLSFRGDLLDGARSQLGLIATGLVETVNEQQGLGLDLNGDIGTDFFRPSAPAVGASAGNTGTGSVAASIDDVAGLTGDRYRLSFDGTDYTLTNLRSNASQTGAGPAFSVDGVSITVSGAPDAGDSFVIEPVAQAASGFEVAISDPRLVAAASPLRSDTSLANAGSGRLDNLAVSDTSGLPLATSVTLTFNPDALGAGVPGYDVAGIAGGPIAYDPATDAGGIEAALGGFGFRLQGVPEAGDSFTIRNNLDGSGDNRNALALASLQQATTLLGGTASFQDAYGTLVAGVAVRGAQARTAAETESSLLEQAKTSLGNIQGVNLDEEAANLLRYQQAYQAAAQVIAVADEVFQTLLAATSR
jgi:flagellar hook-associated protein 1 FlgK